MTDILVHNALVGGGRILSRRTMFRFGGAAVAIGMLTAIGITQPGSVAWPAAVPIPLRSSFARHLGESFLVRTETLGTVSLQLFNVRDLLSVRKLAAQGHAIDAEQNFSIVFQGPVEHPLSQDVYRLEHSQFADLELLFVPLQPDQNRRYYEVIFNRLYM